MAEGKLKDRARLDEGAAAPTNLVEYRRWLHRIQNLEFDDRFRNHYELVTGRLRQVIQEAEYWAQLGNRLQDIDQEYRLTTGFPLLLGPPQQPSLLAKPYESFLLKTLRRNAQES